MMAMKITFILIVYMRIVPVLLLIDIIWMSVIMNAHYPQVVSEYIRNLMELCYIVKPRK